MGDLLMEGGMENGVENLCECLMITDLNKEETHVELSLVDEVVSRGKNCLLVKLLSKKYFNREAFKATMKKVWRPVKLLCFSEMAAVL